MTVKELKEVLSSYDENKDVVICGVNSDYVDSIKLVRSHYIPDGTGNTRIVIHTEKQIGHL